MAESDQTHAEMNILLSIWGKNKTHTFAGILSKLCFFVHLLLPLEFELSPISSCQCDASHSQDPTAATKVMLPHLIHFGAMPLWSRAGDAGMNNDVTMELSFSSTKESVVILLHLMHIQASRLKSHLNATPMSIRIMLV